MSKTLREKFTTTLNPDVVRRLGIMKAIDNKRGLNEVIEELVNRKFEEMEINDKNNKKREASR